MFFFISIESNLCIVLHVKGTETVKIYVYNNFKLFFYFQVALSTVLEKRTQEVVLKNVAEDSWVKLNPGTVRYYYHIIIMNMYTI